MGYISLHLICCQLSCYRSSLFTSISKIREEFAKSALLSDCLYPCKKLLHHFCTNPNCCISLCAQLYTYGLSDVELRITSEFATNHLLCYSACESYHSSIPSHSAIATVGMSAANDGTITERPFASEFKIKESSTCLREAFSPTRGIRSGSVIQRAGEPPVLFL